MPWYSLEYQDVIKPDSTNLYGNTLTDIYGASHVLGKKQYEIIDHLGDVLATVSDKRADDSLKTYGISLGTPDTVRTYKPIVVAAYDYYPFGEYMPTRYTNDSTTHCYTATLPELVPTILYTPIIAHEAHRGGHLSTTGGAVLTDLSDSMTVEMDVSSIGDGLSYDVTGLTPGMTSSVYIDLSSISGSFVATLTDDSTGTVIGSTNVYTTQGNAMLYTIGFTAITSSSTLTFSSTTGTSGHGSVVIIGTPHDTILLENVVTLVCDEEWYRYGYNGQMKNNQWAGLGNHMEYSARGLDTRIGRWISRDPLAIKFSYASSYNFVLNNPILGKDPDGKVVIFINGMHDGNGGTSAYWEGYDDRAMKRIGDHSARYVDGRWEGQIILKLGRVVQVPV